MHLFHIDLRSYRPLELAILIFLFTAICIKLFLGWSFTTDDAYITARYAENWANYGYLGWNLFDPNPVEGYSNTLFLLLGYLAASFNISPLLAYKVTSVVALLTSLVLLLAMVKTLPARYRVMLIALIAANMGITYWAVSGLESLVYVCLNIIAVSLYLLSFQKDGKVSINGLAATSFIVFLCGLTRLEGPMIGITLGIHLIATLCIERTYRSQTIIAIAALALPFTLLYGIFFYLRYQYFGEVFPNTYYVKADANGNLEVVSYFFKIMRIPLIIGLAALWSKEYRRITLLLMLYIGINIYLCWGVNPIIAHYGRLMLTSIVFSCVLAVIGLSVLMSHWGKLSKLIYALIFCVCLFGIIQTSLSTQKRANSYSERQQMRVEIAEFLIESGVKNYAIGDAGIAPYTSKAIDVYDYYGLNSKEFVAPGIAGEIDRYAEWLVEQTPDAIVISSKVKHGFEVNPAQIYLHKIMKNQYVDSGRLFESKNDHFRYKVFFRKDYVD